MQKWSAHAILLGKKLDLLPKRCSFMATWPWRLVGLVLVAMSAPVMSASVLNCGPVRVHQCLVTTIRSYWPLCCHVERSWMLYNLIAHNYSMLAPRFRKSSGIHNIYIYVCKKELQDNARCHVGVLEVAARKYAKLPATRQHKDVKVGQKIPPLFSETTAKAIALLREIQSTNTFLYFSDSFWFTSWSVHIQFFQAVAQVYTRQWWSGDYCRCCLGHSQDSKVCWEDELKASGG